LEGPFVQKVDLAGLYVARFTPGQDLFGRLTEIMGQHDLERVVVLSGIGSLQDVTMRDLKDGIGLPINLDKTNEIVNAGPFELLSLEGSVVPMDGNPIIHLHGVMGMPDGSVIGGHLFEGTVFSTLELFIAGVGGTDLRKQPSSTTGLNEYRVGPES
jgi:predicted DNA-binding protein with PD1-like motif